MVDRSPERDLSKAWMRSLDLTMQRLWIATLSEIARGHTVSYSSHLWETGPGKTVCNPSKQEAYGVQLLTSRSLRGRVPNRMPERVDRKPTRIFIFLWQQDLRGAVVFRRKKPPEGLRQTRARLRVSFTPRRAVSAAIGDAEQVFWRECSIIWPQYGPTDEFWWA
jgi:hypothetical protein